MPPQFGQMGIVQHYVYVPSAFPNYCRTTFMRLVTDTTPEQREFSRKVRRGQAFKFEEPGEVRLSDFNFSTKPEKIERDYDIWSNNPQGQVEDNKSAGMGLDLL